MKVISIFIFSSFIVLSSIYGQDNRRNSIGIEVYSPVLTESMRYFEYTDDWRFSGYPLYAERSFSNFALGISYERALKNNFFIRPRIGISRRKIIETTLAENNTGAQLDSLYHKYNYEQNHINLFFGVGNRFQLTSNFTLSFGLDVAFIKYLPSSGKTMSGSTKTWINETPSRLYETLEVKETIEYGDAMNIGIGPIIRPEFTTKGGVSFSAEAQFFFMHTMADSENKLNRRAERITYHEAGEAKNVNKDEYTTSYDFSQWSWSILSPLVRVGYQF